jgi:hypothetical protein
MKRGVSVGVVIWQKLSNVHLRHTAVNSVYTVRDYALTQMPSALGKQLYAKKNDISKIIKDTDSINSNQSNFENYNKELDKESDAKPIEAWSST